MNLKFRAWYERGTLPMLTVSQIDFENETIVTYIDKEAQLETEMEFDFDEVVLMQSTGLFDKNGVEVFDGDIIKSHTDGVGVVRFHKTAGVYFEAKKGMYIPDWTTIEEIEKEIEDIRKSFEVIGNIYENPELLEPNP